MREYVNTCSKRWYFFVLSSPGENSGYMVEMSNQLIKYENLFQPVGRNAEMMRTLNNTNALTGNPLYTVALKKYQMNRALNRARTVMSQISGRPKNSFNYNDALHFHKTQRFRPKPPSYPKKRLQNFTGVNNTRNRSGSSVSTGTSASNPGSLAGGRRRTRRRRNY